MDGPVFGVFGTEDQVVPVSSVREFETLLSNGSQQANVNVYDGVGHAFANPSSNGFAPNETRDSWSKTLDFLEQELKDNS
jgi:carboxymethylenebutenolidase